MPPTLPADFAETGIWLRAAPGLPPPTRFQVLGERSSGTNYVKRLLGRNTDLHPTEALGWKHGPPAMMAVPADFAVICVVRDARNWALSMYAKPWHTTPDMQRLDFAQFLRAPWDTTIDRPRYFPEAKRMGWAGRPLQADRHLETGARFANLFQLRRAKLRGLLSFSGRDCHVALIRMEVAIADPVATLAALRTGFGLPDRDVPLRPVVKRLGSRFKPAVTDRPPAPDALAEPELAFLRAELDLETETGLGYRY